jgi:hypothetical protein
MHEVRNPKNSRSRAAKLQRPPADKPWIWTTSEMLESPAHQALGGNSLKALDRIKVEHMSHGATQNGQLIVTHDHFSEYGIRRASVAQAIRELEYFGFLGVNRGVFYKGGNEPNLYRLTWLPDCQGVAATNDWKSISKVHVETWIARQGEISKASMQKREQMRARRAGNVVVPMVRA